MSRHVRKSSATSHITWDGYHRFEHWYADNQVYFITARCANRHAAFDADRAKAIFWDRFAYWTHEARFTPWVTSLMNNHYHCLGYCRLGESFGQMMRRIHGSVAKLVNDILPQRQLPFWAEAGHQDYFDGCIRSAKQCRLAFRYVLTQSVRHRICSDWRMYAHTHVTVDLDAGLKRSLELGAFLEGVRYKRYLTRDSKPDSDA